MNTKATHIGLLLLIVAMFGVGLAAYPYLPEQVASHWNSAGVADGYTSKFWGVFMFPLLLAGLYLLYAIIIRIDPMKANIKVFRKQYNMFFLGLGGFTAYVFVLSMAWNLGQRFSFSATILPACAAFLWLLGGLMAHAKRNWFVGIRTPWTLSSDKVWDSTHKLGSRLFKIAAVVTLVGVLFGELGFWFFILPLLAITIATILYSYIAYAKR